MSRVGYDLGSHVSLGLDSVPQGQYEFAITMGCGDECPMINAVHREDWGLPDPKYMDDNDFDHVRDIIEAEVKELIEKISHEKD